MNAPFNLDHQLRVHFDRGHSVAEVRAHFRQIPWSFIADAYFAAWAAQQLCKSAGLSEALSTAGTARGQSRESVALRVLESVATAGLVDVALRGQLATAVAPELAADALYIPRFLPRAVPA